MEHDIHRWYVHDGSNFTELTIIDEVISPRPSSPVKAASVNVLLNISLFRPTMHYYYCDLSILGKIPARRTIVQI